MIIIKKYTREGLRKAVVLLYIQISYKQIFCKLSTTDARF